MEGDLEYDDTLIRPLFQSAKVLPYVYILASRKNGTLYVGVTSDLIKRIYEHKQNIINGFTKKYSVHTLAQIPI